MHEIYNELQLQLQFSTVYVVFSFGGGACLLTPRLQSRSSYFCIGHCCWAAACGLRDIVNRDALETIKIRRPRFLPS